MASFLSTRSKQKSTALAVLFCLERCVPQAERDVHFVRDVSFGSDVRFAREQGTHHITLRQRRNTSLWRSHNITAAYPQHHSKLPPQLLQNTENCAIIKSEGR